MERRLDIRHMLRDVQRHFRDAAHLTGRDTASLSVLKAMARTPRHRFVPRAHQRRAYDDRALPIGSGQTISQPFIVALTAELLDLTPTSRVLDIGTGCGYAAAVMGQLAGEVHTVEVVPKLAEDATIRLQSLDLDNVYVHCADGNAGWPQAAPFDAIACAAAAPAIPPVWFDQLAPGGRLVAPVGGPHGQMLVRVIRDVQGRYQRQDVLPVAFVPLIHR